MWKGYAWSKYPEHRRLWVPIADINVLEGIREEQRLISGDGVSPEARRASIAESKEVKKKGALATARRMIGGLI